MHVLIITGIRLTCSIMFKSSRSGSGSLPLKPRHDNNLSFMYNGECLCIVFVFLSILRLFFLLCSCVLLSVLSHVFVFVFLSIVCLVSSDLSCFLSVYISSLFMCFAVCFVCLSVLSQWSHHVPLLKPLPLFRNSIWSARCVAEKG